MTQAKTVLITGTNSGFGRAATILFRDKGWNVIATQRKAQTQNEFGDSVKIIELELTDPDSIERAGHSAIEHFGRIDVLINNAGFFQMGPIETSTMNQVRAQFEVNFFGLLALTKIIVPHMRENGGGTIVNLASLSAENGFPFASAYSASKAAVLVLSEALNIELDCVNIAVKSVLPGLHATKIFTKVDAAKSIPEAYRPLLGRFMKLQRASGGSSPEDGAATIYRAATDGKKDIVRYFTGPDATPVPAMKRLLGTAGYFKFFRKNLLNGPGPLLRMLSPKLKGKVEISTDMDSWG